MIDFVKSPEFILAVTGGLTFIIATVIGREKIAKGLIKGIKYVCPDVLESFVLSEANLLAKAIDNEIPDEEVKK